MRTLSIKKVSLYLLLILLLICACLVCIRLIAGKGDWLVSRQARYSIPRHIQYSFTLRNTTNRLVKKAELWTYAPVKQTSTQKCVHLETSHPYQLIPDGSGNQILHFIFHNLPPYSTKIINIKADLLLSDLPNPLPAEGLSAHLQAEKYCESDDPEISRLANKLKAPKPDKTAENIFSWVAGNLKYAGYLRNTRGALYALKNKKGDCTEFMYLFAALCRANDIPARGIGGYVCNENTVLKPGNYHNWAEFYDDGVWRIADPQNKVFMKNGSGYIAMRIIEKSQDNPMLQFDKFRVKGPGLKVKMDG